MRQFVYESWNSVMNAEKNPLRHIPDLQTRHMVLQILAWMWATTFALWMGSIWAFGISTIAHLFIIAAIVITVGTFKVAEKSPTSFNFLSGYHSLGRSRNYTIFRDKNGKATKVYLPDGDPGGEHE